MIEVAGGVWDFAAPAEGLGDGPLPGRLEQSVVIGGDRFFDGEAGEQGVGKRVSAPALMDDFHHLVL